MTWRYYHASNGFFDDANPILNTLQVVAIACTLPLWACVRMALRTLRFVIGEAGVTVMACWLPVSVYGLDGFVPLAPSDSRTSRRVAVVGGGRVSARW